MEFKWLVPGDQKYNKNVVLFEKNCTQEKARLSSGRVLLEGLVGQVGGRIEVQSVAATRFNRDC